MEIREGLTFDDVLLIPKYSEVESRANIDLSFDFVKKGMSIHLKHPIIPANMKTICEYEMAEAIWKSGGMALLHRFMEPEQQLAILRRLERNHGQTIWAHIGISVGVKKTDYEIVKMFVDNGVKIICIDVAHGDSKLCVDMCKYIAEKYPNVLLIAGNVATGEAAKRLWLAGADLVKVGVGSGAICSTRLETGCGVPQLSALIEVAEAKKEIVRLKKIWVEDLINATGDDRPTFIPGYFENIPPIISRPIGIIADGGCNKVADLCKSLCFADLTMIGGMVAGTDECPTTKFKRDGKWYKRYDGSSTYKSSRVEGVKSIVPCKGPVQKVFDRIFDGLQSCCSYQGIANLTDLKKNPQFIRVTNNGVRESGIHDVAPIE